MYNYFSSHKTLLINSLTLSRIPFSIIFNIMIFSDNNRLVACSILFAIIVLTDFFDGKLARHYKAETKLGAILDIIADFFFIFTANYFLYEQALLPVAIIAIILIKFAEFCFTSYLINKRLNINKALFFDKIGKFVAIILYLVPITVLILHNFLHHLLLKNIVFYLVSIIGILSLVSFCGRIFRVIKKEEL